MSCEQEGLSKEWNERVVILVDQKKRFLENPELFVEEVWRKASLVLDGIPSDSDLETVCLEKTLAATSVMRPEELIVLKSRLEEVWARELERSEDHQRIFKRLFKLRSVRNSLMVCQDARRVSCIKMVPDL